MQTRLISITKPSIMINGKELSPEDLIVYTARVSSPKNQDNMETAPKLLAYLIKHKHWSPFEMIDMTIEIQTSRAIAAQIIRHKSFSFQEFSQRYSEITSFERYSARRQDEKNRQNSINDLSAEVQTWFANAQTEVNQLATDRYFEALEKGIAKECARFLLPMSVCTKIYMKGSLRSWIHYLQTRTSESTQEEHREVASSILSFFKDNFPSTYKAISDV